MRVFVNNQAARTLLMTFSKSVVNQNDFDKLVHLLQQYQPALNMIFLHFNEIRAYTCPSPLRDLMRCLASNYPVCGFLHFHGRVFEVLEDMAHKQLVPNASDIFLLEQQVPILTRLFKHLHWELPEYLQHVVIELVCKAKVPYKRECHDLPLCDESCSCSGYGYFPTLKKNCHRGDYVMDNRTTKIDLVCSKRKTTHPSLLPGIFTISCIHGLCFTSFNYIPFNMLKGPYSSHLFWINYGLSQIS